MTMNQNQPHLSINNRTRPTDRHLERLYRIPKVTRSLEDWMKVHHRDLAEMDALGLELEDHRVRHRLAYDPRPNDWLLERRQRVRQAIRDRRST
jgi:hypothetical protein